MSLGSKSRLGYGLDGVGGTLNQADHATLAVLVVYVRISFGIQADNAIRAVNITQAAPMASAIQVSSVTMSGPGMYSMMSLMAPAKARIKRSFSSLAIFGVSIDCRFSTTMR